MGQTKSFPDPERAVSLIHGKLHTHLGIISKITKLSHPELLQSVSDLNETTSSFCDQRGKQLHFFIVEGTDATVFWKHTIRICCQKINTRRNLIESSRMLKLRQFIELYSEITEQVSTLSMNQGEIQSSPLASAADISASVIFEEAMKKESNDDEDNECCICMENRSEIILSCTHKFCEGCIDTWNVTSRTCPICRTKVRSADDTWVLTEKPTTTEYDTEVKGYLVGLADRKGQPE